MGKYTHADDLVAFSLMQKEDLNPDSDSVT